MLPEGRATHGQVNSDTVISEGFDTTDYILHNIIAMYCNKMSLVPNMLEHKHKCNLYKNLPLFIKSFTV